MGTRASGVNLLLSTLRCGAFLPFLCMIGVAVSAAQTAPQNPTSVDQKAAAASKSYPPDLVEQGRTLFRQDCSFCHGRDAGGGETGPDLTRSKLVTQDVDGDKIGPVVRNGRPAKGMPPFDRSEEEIASLVAFIHTRQQDAMAREGRGGGRKGVDVSDLQTGNVEAGKQYFEGAGGCANCHSPTGDLSGIASRFQGLELEKQMLYPKNAKSKVTVTLGNGQVVSGTLAYQDEFTIGVTDSSGAYRSWRIRDVHFRVDPGVNAHVELFSKYSDEDIHNLMAFLQTLK